MSSILYTDDQALLAESIRSFCEREAGDHATISALSDEKYRGHNQDIYCKLAELGYIGVGLPEEYGGGGAGITETCILVEEINRGLLPIGGLGVSLIVAGPYSRFGTEKQKKEIIGGICAGRVEAIAMSEPGAGSDVAALKTRAERVGDHFVMNGQKLWTTAAHVADHLLVVVRTDQNAGSKHEGLSMISVPTDTEGLTIRGIETMGGSEVNEVFFSDVRIPADRLLGTEGNGWRQLMTGLDHERLLVAAQGLGRAERAYSDVVSYVKERRQFGQPIGNFQAIRHRLADVATEIESLRYFVYGITRAADADPQAVSPREASMAKLKATELAKTATLTAMQFMGGAGYTVEYGMESQVRAALALSIAGGASEIQRDIISGTYGLH